MPYDDETRPDTTVALSGARAGADRAPMKGMRMGRNGAATGRGPDARAAAADRTRLAAAAGDAADMNFQAVEVALRGLLAPRKTLPPSLFYDEEGCRLFYEITKLPEYYLTRTEFRLLETTAPEVAALLPARSTLVEYGASDEAKAEMLLRQTVSGPDPADVPGGAPRGAVGGAPREAIREAPRGATVFSTYIPIDVAAPALRAMRDRLAISRPGLAVVPVTADFLRPIPLPEREGETTIMGFFPGSTIGNLEPEAAVGFLRRARTTLGQAAKFLLGFDTCQDPARLIPAYDDSQGVTARFNRNLLVRLNREAGARFDPADFAHRAVWNEAESRIEMHLVSRAARTVMVGGQPVRFARDETIHTENSYKYPPRRMRAMIRAAGWDLAKTWSDSNNLFAIWLLD
jgi:dimethylhistidine N-methyltransferase